MRQADHGLLVLDKPSGMTSRAVVDRAQRWFPRRTRLGHTGTLDPLATGVLVLCVGSATRLTEYVQAMNKVYRTRLRLGVRSDTEDADGVVTEVAGAQPPTEGEVDRCLRAFEGIIEQVPPAFSAAKVSGQRAYELARRGREVELAARPVHIQRITRWAYAYPLLELEVHCGKGTYIRALARDLGNRLGCGALVEILRRERVGPFTAADAVVLDADAATARAQLLPLEAAVCELPRVDVSPTQGEKLRHGQSVSLTTLRLDQAALTADTEWAVFLESGPLIAVSRVDQRKGLLVPVKVLPT
ncbi:MAG: tRNA pseudouridine(55) synthase TruB [Gemmataceae bacterium]